MQAIRSKLGVMSSNYALLDDPASWTAFSTPSPQNKPSDKQHGLWQSQVVKSDDIAHGLTDQANHYKADLIVMASHGRKGIKRLLLGSETLAVLTHAKTPVLVLR